MVTSADQAYFIPIPDEVVQQGAPRLGGTGRSVTRVLVRTRAGRREILPVDAVPALFPEADAALARAFAVRPAFAGIALDRPRVMGVVNVTPDSFSDGGRHNDTQAAVAHGLALAGEGADLLDIGGESTRPGAQPVSPGEEADRVLPVIEGLRAAGAEVPISIDTRNAAVARQALAAGAAVFNDVSALTHDPVSPDVAAGAAGVCLMHALGDPRTMQDDPRYEDVVLDVYDYLAARLAGAEAAGIAPARVALDPGIGFGKTLTHNLALIRGLALFQTLGCAVLLGVSRKRFIGTLSGQPEAARRGPGSVAAGLHGLSRGAQILRVHDVRETAEAVRVWQALEEHEQ